MSSTPAKSDLFRDVQATFGTYIGSDMAANAERNLRRWGIDPQELTLATERGHNTRIYKLDDKLLVKIRTEVEQYGQTPLPKLAPVLQDMASVTIGFDMGGAPIVMSVCPYLNTKDVTPAHIKALCHEMQAQYRLLFRDNKMENVGLAEDGTPYIIDAGSLVSAELLRTGEPAFLYPAFSPDAETGKHSYHWPELQCEIPQFKALRDQLTTRSAAAARG
jgi:hypothetical protein